MHGICCSSCYEKCAQSPVNLPSTCLCRHWSSVMHCCLSCSDVATSAQSGSCVILSNARRFLRFCMASCPYSACVVLQTASHREALYHERCDLLIATYGRRYERLTEPMLAYVLCLLKLEFTAATSAFAFVMADDVPWQQDVDRHDHGTYNTTDRAQASLDWASALLMTFCMTTRVMGWRSLATLGER